MTRSIKRLIYFVFIFSLYGEEKPSENLWDYHPLHGGGNVIAIGSADITPKRGHESGDIVFDKANAFLYFLLPVSRTSYFFPRVEYNIFKMDWNKNPKFDQKYFEYMQFALTFYTIAIEKWRWILRADYNLDVHHFSKPKDYGLFSGLFWGTHEIHRKWHYHIGAFGYKGIEGQQIYPIIGFDFSPNKKWFIQTVFPITYSVEYIFTKEWRLGLKGRPLKERFRTGKNEPQPRSIFSYSTMGAEINLHYEKFLRVEFDAFAGYNFGGDFYIKDQKGHHSLYTKVSGAPYIGATLNWGF